MLETLKSKWAETMEIPEARWIVWGTILLVLILVAFYAAKKFRDMAVGNDSRPADYLPDIDKMRLEGKLDDAEYQRLKSSMSEQRNRDVNEETKKKN